MTWLKPSAMCAIAFSAAVAGWCASAMAQPPPPPLRPVVPAPNYAPPAPGITVDSAQPDAWSVNLKDADLTSLVRQVSDITGENFVLPEPLTGKVTLLSPTPLGKQDLENVLQSVLHLYGYSIVTSGRVKAIRAIDQAKRYNVKVDETGHIAGPQFVARVFPIKYANLSDLTQALQLFISEHGVVKALTGVTAILVVDTADNVEKISRLIDTIDNSDNRTVDIIPLKHNVVDNVMPLLEKLAPRELADSAKKDYSPIRIVADDRNNVILVRGEDADRQHMRQLIESLDMPPDAAGYSQVIYLRNANAKNIADILKDFVKAPPNNPVGTVMIKADSAINALVVRAPENAMMEIRQLVSQLDIPRKQVLIEAAIVEVTDDVSKSLGVQFGAGQASTETGLAAGSLSPTSGDVNIAGFMTALGQPDAAALLSEGFTGAIGGKNTFLALIRAMATSSRANLLSTPSVATVDNTEAKIVVGQNVPFRTGSYSTTTSGVTNPFDTIDRQDVGIMLKVTPQIQADGRILLTVDQEVSSISPTTVAGAADIITNKRTINTTIDANNGGTIVLGGLISDNKTAGQSKVPLLGDLPIIGNLFQANDSTDDKQDLLVFLRPTILTSQAAQQQVNTKKFDGLWEISVGTPPPPPVRAPSGALEPPFDQYYLNPLLTPTAIPPAFPWQRLPWQKEQ